MRLNRALIGGAALLALATLTGCGEDDPMSEAGLPSASDMASLTKLIDEHGGCRNLEANPADWDYMSEETEDPAWGIKERAYCVDAEGDDVTLLLIDDMKKFQEQSAKDGAEFQVGKNFAVAAVNENTGHALAEGKLLFMSCDPDFTTPSGYKKLPALVDKCVLSDYLG
ncbi:hypothetical protein [Streptomyces europaeiscabiei]|uniref:hypothetical protein n=1 Tax=Streptomyces europaeiscabiei TaxID=146819 RepID=UPI0038F67831